MGLAAWQGGCEPRQLLQELEQQYNLWQVILDSLEVRLLMPCLDLLHAPSVIRNPWLASDLPLHPQL